jgi:hypothetical protein
LADFRFYRSSDRISGDLHIDGRAMHVRLGPATAPEARPAPTLLTAHRDRTRYPGTELTIAYSVKDDPEVA